MSGREEAPLVQTASTAFERVADGILGLTVLLFVLAFGALAGILPLGVRLAGLTLVTVFGIALGLLGSILLGIAFVSRGGYVETDPDRSAGLGAGLGFGVVGLVVGGVFGAGITDGVLWIGLSLALGLGMVALTVLPREDIGSTVPPALVALLVGGLLVSGLLDIGWQWQPQAGSFSGGFTAEATVPLLVAFSALLSGWALAKARGNFGAPGRERGAFFVVYLIAFGILTVMVAIVAFVTSRGAPYAFRGFEIVAQFPFVKWPFVMRPFIPLTDRITGILPAIVGTVWLVIGATVFAVPLGVGAAVFLTEYAEQGRFTRLVETATSALWSTPSVVFGLFGAAFLIPRLGGDRSLLAGMLVLGFMLLPLVLITSREAIKSVPDEYRDASAALGVTKWETIRSVVLPAAMPGIITGGILGVGRIAGETAPLILVLGSTLNSTEAVHVIRGFEFVMHPPFITNEAILTESAALPTQIWAIISAGVSGSPARGWATAFILLCIVLSFYAVGIASRTYFRRKLDYE
ncbi:MAG: phosphate ABC transporter permease PstA [Halodesulfurarchaeum sp.]